MRYKKGDKVRVRTGLRAGNVYGERLFTEEMEECAGKEFVVDRTVEDACYLDGIAMFAFTDEMLAPVKADAEKEAVMQGKNSHIKDSGSRTQYETGAVRDCKVGKGRCDLLPLDVIADMFRPEVHNNYCANHVFRFISKFKETSDVKLLFFAIDDFVNMYAEQNDDEFDTWRMLLAVSKHFEEGALKYGEYNWQKGIPVHSYIDSAIRHFIKYMDGWDDEPHDRAFVWNLLCCVWTMKHHPELNDFTEK